MLDMTQPVEGEHVLNLEFDLADRLRKSLRASGVGVTAMAAVLGVERNTVGRYINGHITPSRPVLVTWSLRTGAPLDWLEHGVTNSSSDLAGLVARPSLRDRHRAAKSELEAPSDLDETSSEEALRACRDSNPKPSDLESRSCDPAVAEVLSLLPALRARALRDRQHLTRIRPVTASSS